MRGYHRAKRGCAPRPKSSREALESVNYFSFGGPREQAISKKKGFPVIVVGVLIIFFLFALIIFLGIKL